VKLWSIHWYLYRNGRAWLLFTIVVSQNHLDQFFWVHKSHTKPVEFHMGFVKETGKGFPALARGLFSPAACFQDRRSWNAAAHRLEIKKIGGIPKIQKSSHRSSTNDLMGFIMGFIISWDLMVKSWFAMMVFIGILFWKNHHGKAWFKSWDFSWENEI